MLVPQSICIFTKEYFYIQRGSKKYKWVMKSHSNVFKTASKPIENIPLINA